MKNCRVLDSKHPEYPVDTFICGNLGWQTRCIVVPDDFRKPTDGVPPLYQLPDFGGLPRSLGLGVLGMTGYV